MGAYVFLEVSAISFFNHFWPTVKGKHCSSCSIYFQSKYCETMTTVSSWLIYTKDTIEELSLFGQQLDKDWRTINKHFAFSDQNEIRKDEQFNPKIASSSFFVKLFGTAKIEASIGLNNSAVMYISSGRRKFSACYLRKPQVSITDGKFYLNLPVFLPADYLPSVVTKRFTCVFCAVWLLRFWKQFAHFYKLAKMFLHTFWLIVIFQTSNVMTKPLRLPAPKWFQGSPKLTTKLKVPNIDFELEFIITSVLKLNQFPCLSKFLYQSQ